MAKGGKFFKGGKGKQKFGSRKRNNQERDIRPMKKRRMDAESNSRYGGKQKGKFFVAGEVPKTNAVEEVKASNALRKIEKEENEIDHPYKKLLDMFQINQHVKKSNDDITGDEEGESDVGYNDDDDDDAEEDGVGEDGVCDEEDEIEAPDDEEGKDEEGKDEEDNDDDDDEVGDYRLETDLSDDEDDKGDEEEGTSNRKETTKDPFKGHLEYELDGLVANEILAHCKWNSSNIDIPHLGPTTMSYPPSMPGPEIPFEEMNLKNCHIKPSLLKQLPTCIDKSCPSLNKSSENLPKLQEAIIPIVMTYRDLYFPNRTFENGERLRLIYCLHVLNHMSKTRSKVISDNTKIKSMISKKKKDRKRKKNKNKDDGDDDDDDDDSEKYKDQGFTRPKVLILVPFRSCAMKIIQMLIQLLSSDKTMVSKRDRFMAEYGDDSDCKKGLKPDDFEKTFEGNKDENFKIGVSIAKKTLKLYNEFYSSDIIIASPLGLKGVIKPEGYAKNLKKPSEQLKEDDGFLSSIEIIILDQTDVFLMQNWNDVLLIMSHLNKIPENLDLYDFKRVRMWYTNGWASLYRQTLVFSSFYAPEINSVYKRFALNYNGKCFVPPPPTNGTMNKITISLPQMFKRFTVENINKVSEARLQFFIKRVFPTFRNSPADHIMIFIPSYLDFIRVRNYFKKEEIKFEQICEYTDKTNISRARQFFFDGKSKYLLFTERFHYYYRYYMRGVHHIIFYDLPVNNQFYPELCNMIQDYKKETVPVNSSCTVLYCKYDIQKLIGISGHDRAKEMIDSDDDYFSYMSVDS